MAGRPPADLDLPAIVVGLASGRPTTPIWRNDLGGLTVAVAGPAGEDIHIKFQPAGQPSVDADLDREVERLAWAASWLVVPEVLDQGRDDAGSWIVTRTLPAHSAVDERFATDPTPVVRAIGLGLRRMHDTLPVEACPFSWSVHDRLDRLQARHAHRRGELTVPPEIDRLVVCHGDACAPNTLVDDDGGFVGHCDLGTLGTADRWADLAVASMSLEWNYGPGWEPCFFGAYGVDADASRLAYYRDLWNCT